MIRSHITMSFTTAIIASLLTWKDISLPFVLGSMIGGMLPDLDHPRSKIGRTLPLVSHVMFWTFGHRGVTHSWLPIAVLMSVTMIIGEGTTQSFLLGVSLGYVIHLLGDFLAGGIPLLWPRKHRLGIHLIKTGGALEHVFMGIWAGGFFVVLWNLVMR